MKQLIKVARRYKTDQLYLSILTVGGGVVDPDTSLLRAAMLLVYRQREGEQAADLLLDRLGM